MDNRPMKGRGRDRTKTKTKAYVKINESTWKMNAVSAYSTKPPDISKSGYNLETQDTYVKWCT